MITHTYTETRRNWDVLVWKFAIKSLFVLLFALFHTQWTSAVLIGVFVFFTLLLWELGEAYEWEEYGKAVMLLYMEFRWGCHGGLRPPRAPMLWWDRRHDRGMKRWWSLSLYWYFWRLFCWRTENKIYNWTGLPEYWHRSYCALHGLPR